MVQALPAVAILVWGYVLDACGIAIIHQKMKFDESKEKERKKGRGLEGDGVSSLSLSVVNEGVGCSDVSEGKVAIAFRSE